jgi:purine-binding chemotaxis protein CheW
MSQEVQFSPNISQDQGPAEMGETERFLVFSLCKEEYAVPLLKVKEVIALTEITPVPYTPAHFKGIMNLRGHIISVIDLRLKFRMPKAELAGETAIIILDLAPLSFGVIVDSIDSVLAVEQSQLQAPPDIESNVKSDYITGVTRKENKLILLLDIDRTLSVEDLKMLKKQSADKAA